MVVGHGRFSVVSGFALSPHPPPPRTRFSVPVSFLVHTDEEQQAGSGGDFLLPSVKLSLAAVF